MAVDLARRDAIAGLVDHVGGRGLVGPTFLVQPSRGVQRPFRIFAGARCGVALGGRDQFRGGCLLQRVGKGELEILLAVVPGKCPPEFLGLGGVGGRRGLGAAAFRNATTGGRVRRRRNRCVGIGASGARRNSCCLAFFLLTFFLAL